MSLLSCVGSTLPGGTAALAQGIAQAQSSDAAGTALLTPEKLATLLPATVYFQGRTASIQIRNAGGARFAEGAIVWAALVDTSGYATDVQNKYQFYLVTECPLQVGESRLAPGAYGGGFVNGRFLFMDLGGHTIAEGPVQTDETLKHPRPLQMTTASGEAVTLLLGRRSITLHAEAASAQRR